MVKKSFFAAILFFGFIVSSFAENIFIYPKNMPEDVEIYGDFRQGGIIYGKTLKNAKIKINDENVRISEDGIFMVGFDRDAEEKNILSIKTENEEKKVKITIAKRDWNIQRIDGLPEKMVSPDEKTVQRIKDENLQVRKAREKTSNKMYFQSEFIKPVEGLITSPFGAQRILNGEARAPHPGIDIKAETGVKVKASGDGVVSLVHEDMYLTGKTVMINHGLGLSTIYVHLDEINTKTGDKVKKGDIIGTVGKTGRATGSHLHFGVSVGTVRIDPESFLNKNFPEFIISKNN